MHKLSAIVKSGLGEGKIFLSMDEYKAQIRQKLGFDAFPGTLNLEVNEEERNRFLESQEKIIIGGFEQEGKSYGSVDCYKAKLNNVDGAIIVPVRSKYGLDTIEFIAPVNLRKKLNIRDGDKVVIRSRYYIQKISLKEKFFA